MSRNTKPNVSIEDKRKEAVKRMHALGMTDYTIKEFEEYGLVPVFFNDVDTMLNLSKEADRWQLDFERDHNALIYAAINVRSNFGTMTSYLFVSDYEEEWEQDNLDLKDGYVMTWTENLTHPMCSEFGSIAFERTEEGYIRRVS